MKFINPDDAPVQPTPRRPLGTWRPVYDAIAAGKAVVLERAEYIDENKTRNAVSLSMRRWGIPVTIRKDPKTGNLYIFRKDEQGAPAASEALTAIVDEYSEEAEQ
jgi:hypothetical protein